MAPQNPKNIRIVLVDDHELFREGLVRLFEAEPEFSIVGHCGTVNEGLALVKETDVDVVLLDFDLGADKGSDFIRQATERGYKGKILILTAGVTDQDAVQLIRQGVVGIFLKHSSPALLLQSIRMVVQGEVWLDQNSLRQLVHHTPVETESRRRLTDRDRQVMRGVFEGLANKEIADRLQISESSVKASLQQLFDKTGVRTRSQLVRVALEQYREQLL